ncbi:hypothetical protein Tmath_0058 [Thermoanaerobacter mathranii subsp. mathranii str. A3]|nr:hypothetical protein Tmath_0058 [Thermoanaerobacter mathranii subsp. mathranii str. A3]
MRKFKPTVKKWLFPFNIYQKLVQQNPFIRKMKHIPPEAKIIISFFVFFFLSLNILAYIFIKEIAYQGAKNVQILPAFISFLMFQVTFFILGSFSDDSISDVASFLYSIIISVIMYHFFITYPIWLVVIMLSIYITILLEIRTFQLLSIFGLIVYSIILTILTFA